MPTAKHSDIEKAIKKDDKLDPCFAQIPDLQNKAFLKVGVCKEIDGCEKRVAMVPATAKKLLMSGIQIIVENNAGEGGGFYDGDYAMMGCRILSTAQEVYDSIDVVIKVRIMLLLKL